MRLFDIFRKKDIATATDSSQQSTPAQAPASSIIWLPAIYDQFSDKANIDPIYGEKIPELVKTYKSLCNNKAPSEEIQKHLLT